MWKCHKCGKPVYFAERKQSLGYDWHPECLRCEECGKRLNPGQHAEHKSVPYCHVPCYGALFGPQLFGHGTRVESHKSYGAQGIHRPGGGSGGPSLPRDHLESKLKVYNQFYDNKSMEIRSREVNNRLVLEGTLRVYWGVQGVIHLKEDDDQRTFVVRKRNSCRLSKATDESPSDKENELSESFGAATTASEVDGLTTDISLSESMTFDSCSLNDDAISELPTTPEEPSATTTGNSETITNGDINDETSEKTESSSTLCGSELPSGTVSTACVSVTLPSKLEKLEKLEWDEIDDLLQVERKITEKDKIYETMPVKLPSLSNSTSESSSTKTISAQSSIDSAPSFNENKTSKSSTSSDSSGNSSASTPSKSSSSTTSTSSDNFMTATASITTQDSKATSTSAAPTSTNITNSTHLEEYDTCDDATLKPMDFEDFKKSVHQDYLNGANSFPEPSNDTLKRNQPIDPGRINDSLKFYGDNPMSKSFNCEQALRSFDSSLLNDTLNEKSTTDTSHKTYALQKSGSTNTTSNTKLSNRTPNRLEAQRYLFEKGINRSKSGPSCFVYSDSDDDDDLTLKPHRLNTVRRSDIPQNYIKINMDCYPKREPSTKNGNDSSYTEAFSITNSGAAGGDELTQTEDLITASAGNYLNGDDNVLHITEDGVVLRRPPKTGAAAIKRRSGNRRSRTKIKRRCSINGHYYNRETSFFTPPYGSQMSVWVTSMVTTQEVINLLLEKYRVDSPCENFSLFIIQDNGEQKRLKDNDYPLITRVMMGPYEDVARLFLVDARKTAEISNEVAQFLNLSIPECQAILSRYDQEIEREVAKIKDKYAELRRRIVHRMESLKVHL